MLEGTAVTTIPFNFTFDGSGLPSTLVTNGPQVFAKKGQLAVMVKLAFFRSGRHCKQHIIPARVVVR